MQRWITGVNTFLVEMAPHAALVASLLNSPGPRLIGCLTDRFSAVRREKSDRPSFCAFRLTSFLSLGLCGQLKDNKAGSRGSVLIFGDASDRWRAGGLMFCDNVCCYLRPELFRCRARPPKSFRDASLLRAENTDDHLSHCRRSLARAPRTGSVIPLAS